MKKFMKKKVSLLGKEVSVFAIVVVAMIGLASAALVGYLSDDVSGEFDVDSPFTMAISDGHINPQTAFTGDSVTFASTVGGNTVEATVRMQYIGDSTTDIEVKELFTITNTQGVTCDDFESIEFATCTDTCSVMGDFNPIPSEWCTQDGLNTIILTDDSGYNKYIGGEVNVDQIKLNLMLNAIGTYNFNGQVVMKGQDSIIPNP